MDRRSAGRPAAEFRLRLATLQDTRPAGAAAGLCDGHGANQRIDQPHHQATERGAAHTGDTRELRFMGNLAGRGRRGQGAAEDDGRCELDFGAGAEEAAAAQRLVGGPIFSTRSQPSIHEEEDRRLAGFTWDSGPAAQFRPGCPEKPSARTHVKRSAARLQLPS